MTSCLLACRRNVIRRVERSRYCGHMAKCWQIIEYASFPSPHGTNISHVLWEKCHGHCAGTFPFCNNGNVIWQHDENLTPCCNGSPIWTTWEKCSPCLPRLILLSPHGANVSLLLLKQMWFRPHGRSDSYMQVAHATVISAHGSPSENNNLVSNGPHLPSNRPHLYLNMVKVVSNLFTQATPLTYIVQLIN